MSPPTEHEIAAARLEAMLWADSPDEIRAIMDLSSADVAALARGEQPGGDDDQADDDGLDTARVLGMVPNDGESLPDVARRYARVARTLQQSGLSVEQTRAVMRRAADALRPYCSTGPRRYSKTGDKSGDAGRWVQIGTHEGEDGERHGGTPVFIQGGRIVKGPARLTGRHIDRMHEEGEHGSHRQQLAASRERDKAVWGKRARAEGVRPADLHQLAGDMMAHHQAHVEQRQALLKRARQQLAHYGYDARALTTNLRSGRVEDADSVPGLDVVADSLASSYPDHFTGRGSAAEQLLDMFTEGVPPPMDADHAYGEALGHLRNYGSGAADDEREPWDDDEPIPFDRRRRAAWRP